MRTALAALTQRLAPPREPEVSRPAQAELVTCDQTIEQSYLQVKHHLGWNQYQVRSDLAIRRH